MYMYACMYVCVFKELLADFSCCVCGWAARRRAQKKSQSFRHQNKAALHRGWREAACAQRDDGKGMQVFVRAVISWY